MESEIGRQGMVPEMMMFYNVENLFTPDLVFRNRLAPSVSGLKNWNRERYENKLHKIAKVFQLTKEVNGQLPMLIGISEVQGKKPLEDILKLEPFNGSFGFIHYESMDERGVDVALLYDQSKIQVISSEPITFLFEIEDADPENYDATRDVLWCKLKYEEAVFHVFVLHLPSKRDLDVNQPKRLHILKELREKINFLQNENEAVVLMGDFNQNPDEGYLFDFLFNEKHVKSLTNPFSEIFKGRVFSTFHYKIGLLFDQILISDQFLNHHNFPLTYDSAEVFNHPQISNWDKKFLGRPFRTFVGTRYLGGYSDHFPVIVKFVKTN